MEQQVRQVLAAHARITLDVDGLDEDADLYAAGMTSQASVSVMLALEDEFDLEFPDEMLTRSVFASIRSIAAAIGSLQQADS